METEASWLALIPAIVTIVTALLSRRSLESLIAGTIAGMLLLEPSKALSEFSSLLLKVMMEETVAWVIIVVCLMGSLIHLLMKVGAANAFSKAIAARAKNKNSVLLYTWVLGLTIFIDDYLNALAVGSAMRKVSDKFGISREMLAYVVDSTAAPICILIPFSTWAIFIAGLLEGSGYAESGQGMALFISAIPYMLYAWIAVLLVPLVATGIVPALGPMKTAQLNAMANHDRLTTQASDEEAKESQAKMYHFVLPVAILLGVTILSGLDVQLGVIVSVAATILLYGLQRLMAWGEMFDTAMEGMKSMVPALSIVVIAFMFAEVNDRLGLTLFITQNVAPVLTPSLLPAVVFITIAFVSFATGSAWGVFAAALPIILPLAEAVDVDIAIAIGALASASAFGSHACFYSDATVLSSQGSGCGVIEHALTQFPYALIAGILASIGLTLVVMF